MPGLFKIAKRVIRRRNFKCIIYNSVILVLSIPAFSLVDCLNAVSHILRYTLSRWALRMPSWQAFGDQMKPQLVIYCGETAGVAFKHTFRPKHIVTSKYGIMPSP